MKVFVASDHAGFDQKQALIPYLQSSLSLTVVDLGPANTDSVDYPDYADRVCQQMKSDPDAIGILFCGSGQGMAMRANKYPHIRAALCWNTEIARLSREHNDANILCLPARFVELTLAQQICAIFFQTPFAQGRHKARVVKVNSPI